jgi:bifunctional DNA-binding transcriptional regulator/antitoxin component of YhaV-PrlF toxin-antitoxin module
MDEKEETQWKLVKMNAKGEVKIPEEFMKKYNWHDGDHVSIKNMDDGSIEVKKL